MAEQREREQRKDALRAQLQAWAQMPAHQRIRRAELLATAYGLDDLPGFEAELKRDRPTPEAVVEHGRILLDLFVPA
ncbi:hypothetical protein ACFY00_29990 [Kitasatospora sp. NPDC001540]|uniref:hypothetical protein n=1 Tax=Kitasatospora sp. NPDC001540 TaxID=3364014 RepID=UPI0036C51785